MLALLPLSGTEMSFLGVLAHGLYVYGPFLAKFQPECS